jgi:hypothetical protein
MSITKTILIALLFGAPNLTAQGYNFQQQEKKQEEKNKSDKSKDEPEKPNQKELEEKACGLKEVNYTARTDKKQRPTPEPPPGKAIIYVIRPTMMGNKIQSKLAVNGEWKGANRGDNYFYLELAPGEYHFCSQAENRSLLTLTVEAGKTYYLQQKIQMGFMFDSSNLDDALADWLSEG